MSASAVSCAPCAMTASGWKRTELARDPSRQPHVVERTVEHSDRGRTREHEPRVGRWLPVERRSRVAASRARRRVPRTVARVLRPRGKRNRPRPTKSTRGRLIAQPRLGSPRASRTGLPDGAARRNGSLPKPAGRAGPASRDQSADRACQRLGVARRDEQAVLSVAHQLRNSSDASWRSPASRRRAPRRPCAGSSPTTT